MTEVATYFAICRKANVLPTTIATREERPEPAGSDPETNKSTETSKLVPSAE